MEGKEEEGVRRKEKEAIIFLLEESEDRPLSKHFAEEQEAVLERRKAEKRDPMTDPHMTGDIPGSPATQNRAKVRVQSARDAQEFSV